MERTEDGFCLKSASVVYQQFITLNCLKHSELTKEIKPVLFIVMM